MGHTAMVGRQQVDLPTQHDKLVPTADTDTSQEQSDGTPEPADKLAQTTSGSQRQQHQHAAQDTSTTSSREVLLQNALALFMPGRVPPYAQNAATAAAADGANGSAKLPGLPNFADSRELQLVAAAFAAGAAAGAAGQLGGALPLLEQFSSGDVSNSGLAVESAAPVTADAAADSLPAAPQEATTAAAAAPQQASKPKAGKARSSAAANHKSTFRGVFWDRKNNRWRAQVGHNNRKIFMGYFSEPTEAARAYDKKLVQLRGTMAKTNFPLQDYADDLKLHKELRARENGDELLLLPLEELQAHLQQHLRELLPKQPALQKVYNDWSRCKAQSEAMMQLSSDRMRQQGAMGGYAQWEGQAMMGAAAAGMGMGSMQMDWVCDTADAAKGEQAQLAQPSSLAVAGMLDQQWSSSLPGPQQQGAQAQAHQQQQQAQAEPMEVDAAPLPPAPCTGSPVKPTAAREQMQQPQQVGTSRDSSPTGTQEGGSSGGSNTRATVSSGSGARAASGCTPVAHRQVREPPKTLQQHLLTRLHEQRVHRSSSGTSMDALLAAAAVLEEEEEVAATLCGQLHDFVASASPEAAAASAQQASGDATTAAPAVAAGAAGAGASASAQAAAGAAQRAPDAPGAAAPKGSKSVRVRRGVTGTVVTDHAAVVAAILAIPASKQQQGTAAPGQQKGEEAGQQANGGAAAAAAVAAPAPEQTQEPGKQPAQQQQQQDDNDQGEESALGALYRRMLQAPTTEKQILQTVQLADKAGLNKEGQQLLLLVMYHQVIGLQKQLTRQQQQPPRQSQQQTQKASVPPEQPAGATAGPAAAPEPASTAAAADGVAAANKLEAATPHSPSAKRQQEAQQCERPAKQVCQGVGSAQQQQQQPGRPVAAGVAGGSCASQGASMSVQAKPQPVLDLSSC